MIHRNRKTVWNADTGLWEYEKDQYGDPKTHGSVYILALEDDCWYVGHSLRIRKRMYAHFHENARTKWTALHPPVSLQTFIDGTLSTEREVTQDMIRLYGIDKVRGASPYHQVGTKEYTEVPNFKPVHFTQWFRREDRLNWREVHYPVDRSRNIKPPLSLAVPAAPVA